MSGGWLIVPLENAGLGTAIDVRAGMEVVDHMREEHREARIGVIAAGPRPRFPLCSIARLAISSCLSFQDHLARRHRLKARWTVEDRSYTVHCQPRASRSDGGG